MTNINASDTGIAVGKGAAHLTFARIVTLTISLVTNMLLSRFRTVAEYGTYSQLMLVITLATSFMMLGLPNSVNYFLARADTQEERINFLSVYYSLSTILSFVVGIVLVAIVPIIEAYFKNVVIRKFAYFLALYPWTRVTVSSISNVLVVYGKTKRLMFINVITALVALLSILLIQLLGLTFRDYITAFLIGHLAIAVWIYVIVSRLENGMAFRLQSKPIREIFSYSIPIGLAAMAGTISIEIDKLMIGGLMGTEALAMYTNAGRELPLTLVASSLTAVLLPKMARMLKHHEKAGAVALWGDAIQLSYILICFFVTASIVFAPQVITILYSQKYLPGVQVFRVYSLVLLLRITYFGIILNSIGKTKLIFWSSLASLGLNAVLNYLMYLMFGFVGPAFATFTSILLVNLLQLIFTSRVLLVPFSKLFPWRKLLEISAVNAFWGIICYFFVRSFALGTDMKSIAISAAIGLLVTIVYILVMKEKSLALWRSLNKDDST